MTAQNVTATDPTVVNTTTVESQQAPTIATLADGGYVIAWQTWDDTTNVLEIYAQRFNSTGVAAGSQFHVNTIDYSYQTSPVVTGLADGGFVIAWGRAVGATGVYQQRFDANGTPVGTEAQVNTYTHLYQEQPSITALSDGGWFVAWQSQGQDGNSYGIYGQRYDSTGAATGGEIHLTDRVAGNQDAPRVASLADGGFIVVFEDYNGGTPAYDVYAQRYDASSQKVGSDVMISVPANYRQQYAPSVTAMSDGGYLVVWQSQGQDGDGYGIYSRRYDSSGNPVTGEVLVNTTTAHDQERPSVTVLDNGDYVVTWQSTFNDWSNWDYGPDGAVYTDVYAQVFANDGTKIGPEIHANTVANADFNDAVPQVAALSGGRFVITWSGHSNYDSQDYDIYQAVYTVDPGYVTLTGDGTANTLDGTGIDAHMAGLGGDDTYIVDSASDQITENVNDGTDTVQSSISWTLGDNIENLTLTGSAVTIGTGNALDNVLTGSIGNNALDGKAGNDTMIGGDGADTYFVDSAGDIVVEAANAGVDWIYSSVSYTASDNVEYMLLTGSGNINGTAGATAIWIQGNGGNNILTGSALADTLEGQGGNDVLDGGAGADTMRGGTGDDTYYVDNSGDVVTENVGEGTDTVITTLTYYYLPDNVEKVSLAGSANLNAWGNSLDNTLTGNSGTNLLSGGDGNDVLDGGAGADNLYGGTGDDTYYVDDSGDHLFENVGGGTDLAISSVSFSLAGQQVENLTLTGSANLTATGNSLANILTGNSGGNVLDGGYGADTLIGGDGNDSYYVDNTGDVVTENASEGTDTVFASVNWTLGANVENLTLTGTANLNGAGNSLNNVLTGNSGANQLSGGDGNDSYYVDNAGDVVTENASEGTDTVFASVNWTLSANVENLTLTGTASLSGTGNGLNNVLTGNSGANQLSGGDGNDVLDGGAGADNLYGGAGDDTYYVDDSGDHVYENANAGTDLVISSVSFSLSGQFIENLTLTGTDNLSATGNGLGNVIIGNSGNNIIDGGYGNDILTGGAGADLFWFKPSCGADTITDFSVADNDMIKVHAICQGTVHDDWVVQNGSDVVISLGGGYTITVLNATVADVSAHMIW